MPQDLFVVAQSAFETSNFIGMVIEVHQYIVAFIDFIDGVSQFALAPAINLGNLAAVVLNEGFHIFDSGIQRRFVQICLEDKNEFIIVRIFRGSFPRVCSCLAP